MAQLTPYVRGMELGVGVNALNGDIRGDAVDFQVNGLPASSQEILLTMRRIDSSTELLESLGIGVQAEGRYGMISGSAEFKLASETKVSEYSTFYIVKMDVVNSFVRMRGATLRKMPADIVREGDINRFREAFGDSYVAGLQTGGFFYACLEFKSRSQSEKQNISASLNVSYSGVVAGGSVSAQISSSLSRASATQDVSLTLALVGGDPNKPLPGLNFKIDEFANFAASFGSDVARHGVPNGVLLLPYQTLENCPPFPLGLDLELQAQALSGILERRVSYMAISNQAEYIENNPRQFDFSGAMTLSDVSGTREMADNAANALAAAASRCARSYAQCEMPSRLPAIDRTLFPKRVESLPDQYPVPNLVGMRLSGVSTTYARGPGLTQEAIRSSDDYSDADYYIERMDPMLWKFGWDGDVFNGPRGIRWATEIVTDDTIVAQTPKALSLADEGTVLRFEVRNSLERLQEDR